MAILRKAKCKNCGREIIEIPTISLTGNRRAIWCGILKGQLRETCPASFLFRKKHVPNVSNTIS